MKSQSVLKLFWSISILVTPFVHGLKNCPPIDETFTRRFGTTARWQIDVFDRFFTVGDRVTGTCANSTIAFTAQCAKVVRFEDNVELAPQWGFIGARECIPEPDAHKGEVEVAPTILHRILTASWTVFLVVLIIVGGISGAITYWVTLDMVSAGAYYGLTGDDPLPI
eukprot:102654_1